MFTKPGNMRIFFGWVNRKPFSVATASCAFSQEGLILQSLTIKTYVKRLTLLVRSPCYPLLNPFQFDALLCEHVWVKEGGHVTQMLSPNWLVSFRTSPTARQWSLTPRNADRLYARQWLRDEQHHHTQTNVNHAYSLPRNQVIADIPR